MHTREKGQQGETIACTFLENKGFTILARNYWKPWGEIDIIAQKGQHTHFIEVKSVTTASDTLRTDFHRPEDNVHALKIKRMRRMIGTYFAEQGSGGGEEFQIHVLSVFMNLTTRKARVKWIKNIIL